MATRLDNAIVDNNRNYLVKREIFDYYLLKYYDDKKSIFHLGNDGHYTVYVKHYSFQNTMQYVF